MRVNRQLGFTLFEVLVVSSIIALLAGIVVLNVNEGGAQGRDAERQADVRLIESALRQYYHDNGRYPEGCNGPNTWSGEPGTDHACPADDPEYIIGLAPAYLSELPGDPNLQGDNAGYVYRTDPTGTVFKFKVLNTVENEEVTIDHPLASCDIRSFIGVYDNIPLIGMCRYKLGNPPGQWGACIDINNDNRVSEEFKRSYGSWGGVLPKDESCSSGSLKALCEIRDTANVICQ